MTPEALQNFRLSMPHCELAMLADVSTGTILAADGALKYGQEHLDTLCTAARAVLSVSEDKSQVQHAIEARPTGFRLFVRSTQDPTEALCAVFAPNADLTETVTAAMTCLATPPVARAER